MVRGLEDGEFFGSKDQQAILRRGSALARILGHDPRYSYYGRAVGLATPEDGDIEALTDLTRLQGNSNYGHIDGRAAPAMAEALADRGLASVCYRKWEGDASALAAAEGIERDATLPDDLTIVRIDRTTPRETLQSLADMALGAGVLPLAGAALRSLETRTVCLVAMDKTGRVLSCAASSAYAHPDHVLGGQAWWGMLATDPDRRGQRLALILGAQVMLAMKREFGFSDFMTGVEEGNSASEAVCRRMGLSYKGASILACTDPTALAAGRMTR